MLVTTQWFIGLSEHDLTIARAVPADGDRRRSGRSAVRAKFSKGSQKMRGMSRRPRGGSVILRAVAALAAHEVRSSMIPSAPSSAVLFLFALSFLCFMSAAALRRWPERVQAYMDRYDGSLWFVSESTHRALINATAIALTGLSLLAVVAARFVA